MPLDPMYKRIFTEAQADSLPFRSSPSGRFLVSESEPVVKKRRRDGAGFSVPAAAEEIGVSYKTLRDAIEMKQVRAIKFGRITRVPKAEVARLKEVFA
jgi:excisionase family DNA binding protein